MDTFMSLQCQSIKTRRQRCILIRADPVALTLFSLAKQNDIHGRNLDIESKSIMNSDCRTLKRRFSCVFHSCLHELVFHSCLRELALTCSLHEGIFVCSVCLSDFKLNLNFPSWALHRPSRAINRGQRVAVRHQPGRALIGSGPLILHMG